MWVNCLNFWTDVQEYHLLFYAEVIDPYIVQKKAKVESYKQYEKILMQSKSNFAKNMNWRTDTVITHFVERSNKFTWSCSFM